MRRSLTTGVIGIAFFCACALAQSSKRTTGTVHGTVFIVDDDGGRSVIPSAKVRLTGPTHTEAQSHDQGNFSFELVPTGDYAGPMRAGQGRVHNGVQASDHYPISFDLAK